MILPGERGGWWHAYICPVHGVELSHSSLLSGTFPAEGVRCPYGCRVDTPEVRGGWAALAHQACAREIRWLASSSPTRALALLVEYGSLYGALTAGGQHEQAQSWMLRGNLFHQALSEAIWAVNIGHAAWTLATSGTDGVLASGVLPQLDALGVAAAAGRDVLVAEGRFSSNYTAWLNAAGAVTSRAAALIRGGEPDASWWSGPHGLYAHVLASTGEDGWEWEVSTYYHGFVLRAYLLSLRGADPAALPSPVGDRIERMIGALAGLASPGGVLPELHDGPYRRPATAAEVAELGHLATQFTHSTHFPTTDLAHPGPPATDLPHTSPPVGELAHSGPLAAVTGRALKEAAEGQHPSLTRRLPLDGWFRGEPRKAREPMRLFRDAGIAVVRGGGVHAVLDFGPHGGSHGHHDKLALYLYGHTTPWQPDPGQVPYAHERWRVHYAGPSAHPAPGVVGVDPAESTGTLVQPTADAATTPGAEDVVTATCADTYPGAVLTRTVIGTPDYLLDLCTVTAAGTPLLRLRPAVPIDVTQDGDLAVTRWRGEEELRGLHLATAPATLQAAPGPGTADDPQRALTHLDWVAHEPGEITFCSVYQATTPTTSAPTEGATVEMGTPMAGAPADRPPVAEVLTSVAGDPATGAPVVGTPMVETPTPVAGVSRPMAGVAETLTPVVGVEVLGRVVVVRLADGAERRHGIAL